VGNESSQSTQACGTTQANPSVPGAFQWSRNFSNTSNAYGQSIAYDSKTGNVIIAGNFAGTVDFGGGPVTSSSSSDIYVAAYSSAGTYLWAKRFGNGVLNYAYGVAVDSNSNVFVTGGFQGTLDFGNGPLTSAGCADIFVAKYSSSGTPLWSKRFGSSTNNDYGYGISVDVNNNVVLTGYFNGTVDFGGGPLTSFSSDTFVVKLSGTNGGYLWAKNFSSSSGDMGVSIATDTNGDVFVTGVFMGAIYFGGNTLNGAGQYDIFLVKLSGTNGAHLWSKKFGNTGSDDGYSVAVDSSNDVVITGDFSGTVDFGGGPLTSAGATEVFLAKYSGSDGSHLWSKRFASSIGTGYGVAVDKYTNDIVMTGMVQGTADFGGGPVTIPSPSMFIAKYSSTGSYLWSKHFGALTFNATGEGVAVDGGGNALVTGEFQGTVNFGGGPQASANGASYIYDIFLVKFGQ
jgi:hypothetical protein